MPQRSFTISVSNFCEACHKKHVENVWLKKIQNYRSSVLKIVFAERPTGDSKMTVSTTRSTCPINGLLVAPSPKYDQPFPGYLQS